jgi:coproporphyrinogen III oxidase
LLFVVMPALLAGIYVLFNVRKQKNVDRRGKPGDDERCLNKTTNVTSPPMPSTEKPNLPSPLPHDIDARKAAMKAWYESLRDRICALFEAIEGEIGDVHAAKIGALPAGRFVRTPWKRPTADGTDAGGGVMSVMKGRVFEKVGVNVSTVHGSFAPEFARAIPGAELNPRFWASGISLVAHPHSPKVPTVHMNTRFIVTTKAWFGGGSDLTPMAPERPDTETFHAAMKTACDRFDAAWYPRFKSWCDDYFYLPHRKEARGVGGIFFDWLDSGDRDRDAAFSRAVGEAFFNVYPKIVRAHYKESWNDDDRRHQLVRRGRYAEFNLLYDRGTQFGLKTDGNVEAILMSLPPLAAWP